MGCQINANTKICESILCDYKKLELHQKLPTPTAASFSFVMPEDWQIILTKGLAPPKLLYRHRWSHFLREYVPIYTTYIPRDCWEQQDSVFLYNRGQHCLQDFKCILFLVSVVEVAGITIIDIQLEYLVTLIWRPAVLGWCVTLRPSSICLEIFCMVSCCGGILICLMRSPSPRYPIAIHRVSGSSSYPRDSTNNDGRQTAKH